MANYNPERDLTAGIAGQSNDTIGADQVSFLGGDLPPLFGKVHTVLSGQVLEALEVVGLDVNGKIVAAVLGTTEAVGVMPYAVDASAGDVESEVYRSGNFNPDQLVWDATYDTDAKKAAAFDGAPSPTQILVTKTRTYAV